jgi:hypothetical protein
MRATPQVFIGPTALILECLFEPRYDEHMKAWRWHEMMVQADPGYLSKIAARQAWKRAVGIGQEGLCRA